MSNFQKYSFKHHLTLVNYFLLLVFSVMITTCTTDRSAVSLPPPKETCPVTLDWKTIKPGVSTRQNVLDVLGQPIQTGETKFVDGRTIPYFAYPVEGGSIASFAQHKIFFRPDGKVDWIQLIVADWDGEFHTTGETINQLGSTLDIVYDNSDWNPFAKFQYDVISGPDQIYVWSNCGMALDALRGVVKSDLGDLEISRVEYNDPQVLSLRYPKVFPSSFPVKDLKRVVMMKFLFQPTNFDGFMKNYQFRIPNGEFWNEYLQKRQK